MLGRGQRARGTYKGIVFIKNKEGMEESIADIIKTETRFDFKDGAKNLRVMSEVKDSKIKNINWLMFAKKVGEKWINHRNDFVGLVEGSLKTTINTLYDNLKDYEHTE